jgi:spermidine/putrescine-binding protein
MSDFVVSRRDLLVAGASIGAAIGLGGAGPWTSAAQAQAILNLSLQAQWWSPEYEAACAKTTGVRVRNTPTQSSSTTLSKLMAGGGRDDDIVQITHPFVQPLVEAGKLQAIDYSRIPNAQHLFERFQLPDYVKGKDGKPYAIPFVWGYDSLLYNADHIKAADSFQVLFDERYKGKIGLRDDPYYSLSVAALALGKKDSFRLDSKELQEVKRFLISKKPVFRTLWQSFSDVVTLMKSQDIWATQGWLPMYWVLKRQEKMNIGYPIPKEGAPGWVGVFIIPKESANMEANYRFLEWILSPEWSRAIGEDKGYYAASKRALEGMSPEIRSMLGYDTIEEQMKKLFFVGLPDNLQEWTQAWTEFKAA